MRRVSGRRVAGLVVILAIALVFIMPTSASAGPRINCEASGRVDITGATGAWNWSLSGLGLCVDFLQGPYQVSFNGTGTSASLGLCDGLVVTDLRLNIHVFLLNLKTGAVRQIDELWGSPITTFPVATPFLLGGAGAPGLGSIFTRILLTCPPGGGAGATFTWTQAT